MHIEHHVYENQTAKDYVQFVSHLAKNHDSNINRREMSMYLQVLSVSSSAAIPDHTKSERKTEQRESEELNIRKKKQQSPERLG